MAAARRWSGALAASLLALAACGGGGGGVADDSGSASPLGPGDQALADGNGYSSDAGAALPQGVTEAAAVTHHTLALGGTTLAYTATAGHLIARDPANGQPEASFFYVAYTADGADPATRPVTFFYNGGPGSATVWLHLGLFGPKRLVTGDPSTNAPLPFPLVDNAESLLDTSDLVFVDAVGSGYSEAVAPHVNQTFWGVDGDAAVFRDFVVRYLEANGRRASPLFLFGESYGTTRSAVLARLLETAGVGLRGVVLQSSILNYGSNCGVLNDPAVPCSGFVPSYGAVGGYYRLLQPNPTDLPDFAAQMRSFTRTSYDPAVNTWIATRALPDASVISQLVDRTGVQANRWQSRFNLDPTTFQLTLIPSVLIGRYDARVSAPANSALASEGDPSSTFISAQFRAAIGAYLRDTLHYTNGSRYVLLGSANEAWDYRHDGFGLPDTVPDLATALTLNPSLQVLAVSGYHDLATPFHQTERDLERLGSSSRITVRNYAGGHMTYLDDTSRAAQKADLRAFYQRVTGR